MHYSEALATDGKRAEEESCKKIDKEEREDKIKETNKGHARTLPSQLF